MKFRILFISFFMVLISCKEYIKPIGLDSLSGYWEIEKVILPDGSEKIYKANDTFDYFELNDSLSFRKKVVQQFDGSFISNEVLEKFTITTKDGIYFINYTTKYAKWQEEILSLNNEKLVVKNNNEFEYHYKRPVLFSPK